VRRPAPGAPWLRARGLLRENCKVPLTICRERALSREAPFGRNHPAPVQRTVGPTAQPLVPDALGQAVDVCVKQYSARVRADLRITRAVREVLDEPPRREHD
jgi:hypothetical protein